jgi:hypothetical protein
MRRKRYTEAQLCYRQAVPILERTWDPSNPQLLRLLDEFVALLRINHEYADAQKWEVRATNLRFHALLQNR